MEVLRSVLSRVKSDSRNACPTTQPRNVPVADRRRLQRTPVCGLYMITDSAFQDVMACVRIVIPFQL